jgi:nitroreductase
MVDAVHLLKTRKSLPSGFLAEPGPSEAQLMEMLAIATHVPDHGKLAPWRFIVVSGDARRQAGERVGAIFRAKNPDAPAAQVEAEAGRFQRAPVTVIVVSSAAPHVKIPEWEQVLSAGNTALSLLFAAHALGFSGHWTTGFVAYDADARRAMGLQEWERIVAVVEIGTPTAPPKERPRPDLAGIVSRWQPPAGG